MYIAGPWDPIGARAARYVYIYMKNIYIYIFAWVNSLIMIYVHDPYMQRGGPEGMQGKPDGSGQRYIESRYDIIGCLGFGYFS